MAHLIDLSDFPLVNAEALRNQQIAWTLEPRLFLDPTLDCITEEDEEDFFEEERKKKKKKKKRQQPKLLLSPGFSQLESHEDNPLEQVIKLGRKKI